jgi:hypothetical protein
MLRAKGTGMPQLLDAPPAAVTLFHCRTGGFPLTGCSYTLLDADGNDVADLAQVTIVRVTARTGERFRLRDPADIRRFLVAVGRNGAGEVAP